MRNTYISRALISKCGIPIAMYPGNLESTNFLKFKKLSMGLAWVVKADC